MSVGEVKFGLSQKAKTKAQTKVWSKSKLKTELDLMSAIWSETILKSKVWTKYGLRLKSQLKFSLRPNFKLNSSVVSWEFPMLTAYREDLSLQSKPKVLTQQGLKSGLKRSAKPFVLD